MARTIESISPTEMRELYNKMNTFDKELNDKKIDCEVMKNQVSYLSSLCEKMDTIIDKLMDVQSKTTSEIYNDMEKKRLDIQSDIKDLHNKIYTIDKSLTDKMDQSERRIMDEIKSLRKELLEHNGKEEDDLKKILEWKWMIIGGVLVVSWIFSNISLEHLAILLK